MLGNFRKSKNILAILPISIFALAILSFMPVTHAYGNTALWQVTESVNCNNPDPNICGGGGGGFWVWAELDSVGGDATVTGCGHSGGPALGLSPPYGGAGHTNIQILSWTVGANGNFVILGEVDTNVGHGTPTSVTFSPEYFDTGIPAAPGHYSFHPAPGVSIQIQVVQLH